MDKKIRKSEKILDAALLLFSTRGFYATTIPDIAKAMGMSVGNLYNYFSSKEILAKEIIKYSSDILGAAIRTVNEEEGSAKEKIRKIVAIYFEMATSKPQHINYFLRVYLANKEVFKDGCEGMLCVSSFVTELMIFFEEGVASGELRNQDFFSAFGLFMGYLGGFVFLNGEGVLEKDLNYYVDDIALNIYNALKKNQ
ncbi:transcriptional regulator, TetR family [Sulfurospirillum diekertiae]|uniref:Transcriptional regulator, TetR family n=1 Tax=Sulfurospirillum diekertiae TaxID=1854492 RepID=A0A290HV12_9BACT|nr:transcriptional regulator, TetR family [Sulfurospirillum diekertiae]